MLDAACLCVVFLCGLCIGVVLGVVAGVALCGLNPALLSP